MCSNFKTENEILKELSIMYRIYANNCKFKKDQDNINTYLAKVSFDENINSTLMKLAYIDRVYEGYILTDRSLNNAKKLLDGRFGPFISAYLRGEIELHSITIISNYSKISQHFMVNSKKGYFSRTFHVKGIFRLLPIIIYVNKSVRIKIHNSDSESFPDCRLTIKFEQDGVCYYLTNNCLNYEWYEDIKVSEYLKFIQQSGNSMHYHVKNDTNIKYYE